MTASMPSSPSVFTRSARSARSPVTTLDALDGGPVALAEVVEDDRLVAFPGQQGRHVAADVSGSPTDENLHGFMIFDL